MGEGIPPFDSSKAIRRVEPPEKIRDKKRNPDNAPDPRIHPETPEPKKERETEKPPIPPGQPGHNVDREA